MRKRIREYLCAKASWTGLIFGATLWASTAAMAGGLGEMTVRSTLGQPLVADIELVIRDKRELDALSARIAPANAHQQAAIPYLVTALGLRANIQMGKDGRSFIRVTSVRPVGDPAIKLLIELAGPGTNAQREYNALLEPPELQRR
jgi:pilus assembly protein FimV